jgi:2-polyprenyl-3-methyl-5-hydroxy-6-metoxy-1,4-benzoquinol methylase
MNVREAYDHWSSVYDTNANRTRDLEGLVLREVLNGIPMSKVLEIGCGTGKNTGWFIDQGAAVTAVDLSEGMLRKARGKVSSDRVRFVRADILDPWDFHDGPYDLVTFSLVLEHVEHLGPVLHETATSLAPGGHVYIGELHPYKQYLGTKARFDSAEGPQIVTCHTHHLSDHLRAGRGAGLALLHCGEHFGPAEPDAPPRILSLVFRKP